MTTETTTSTVTDTSGTTTKLRPGLIVYDDGAVIGPSIILRVNPRNGDIVTLDGGGHIWTRDPADFNRDATPEPGSAQDVMADHIAEMFQLHPDTEPYAPKRPTLPILNTPAGIEFRTKLLEAMRLDQESDWTAEDIIAEVDSYVSKHAMEVINVARADERDSLAQAAKLLNAASTAATKTTEAPPKPTAAPAASTEAPEDSPVFKVGQRVRHDETDTEGKVVYIASGGGDIVFEDNNGSAWTHHISHLRIIADPSRAATPPTVFKIDGKDITPLDARRFNSLIIEIKRMFHAASTTATKPGDDIKKSNMQVYLTFDGEAIHEPIEPDYEWDEIEQSLGNIQWASENQMGLAATFLAYQRLEGGAKGGEA